MSYDEYVERHRKKFQQQQQQQEHRSDIPNTNPVTSQQSSTSTAPSSSVSSSSSLCRGSAELAAKQRPAELGTSSNAVYSASSNAVSSNSSSSSGQPYRLPKLQAPDQATLQFQDPFRRNNHPDSPHFSDDSTAPNCNLCPFLTSPPPTAAYQQPRGSKGGSQAAPYVGSHNLGGSQRGDSSHLVAVDDSTLSDALLAQLMKEEEEAASHLHGPDAIDEASAAVIAQLVAADADGHKDNDNDDDDGSGVRIPDTVFQERLIPDFIPRLSPSGSPTATTPTTTIVTEGLADHELARRLQEEEFNRDPVVSSDNSNNDNDADMGCFPSAPVIPREPSRDYL